MPHRKHPTHGVLHVDGQPTIIFDTVCTKDRRPWLACELIHTLLKQVWCDATSWLLGRYVIMPNHIHFFAGATENSTDYDRWVRYWKSQLSRKLARPACRWQVDHWDTRIRSADVYEEKWHYVLNNLVRQGLVNRPDEWPYQGEIYALRWE